MEELIAWKRSRNLPLQRENEMQVGAVKRPKRQNAEGGFAEARRLYNVLL